MTQFKEKILADLEEKAYPNTGLTKLVVDFKDIKKILATIPTEREIALKVVFEWWESLDQDTIDKLELNVYDLVRDWLGEETQ